ncbi:SDR family NAD(P)-dependent oxidoreductase [Actinobaculum suis]|uniref:SDR family NAD(P)-dependent oxidoreductase n=1 Tax=Actinobaculum suis TaxID=1657 RepID=UPI000B2276D4|nr:SDR family NAD(P)-dependent oxidoreductase [Actinobaculum suis]
MTTINPSFTAPAGKPIALITGGTSGIGRAFARLLAQRGYNLVIVARGTTGLAETAAELQASGVACEQIRADLADPETVTALCEWVASRNFAFDVFVNNAGTGLYQPLATTDFAEAETALTVMGRAPVKLGGAVAQKMREAGSGQIINISSVQGFVPMGMYAAIKAFIRVWSESLALELAGTGVTVTAVLPGWVRSGFHRASGGRRSGVPDFLWLDPQQVAAAGLRAAERGKIRCTPSRRYQVIAFLAEKGPRRVVNRVARALRSAKSSASTKPSASTKLSASTKPSVSTKLSASTKPSASVPASTPAESPAATSGSSTGTVAGTFNDGVGTNHDIIQATNAELGEHGVR